MAIRDGRHASKSKQITSLVGFDVALPIGLASTSRDLVFHCEMKNIKKDTFILGDCNKNVNI